MECSSNETTEFFSHQTNIDRIGWILSIAQAYRIIIRNGKRGHELGEVVVDIYPIPRCK